MLVRFAWQMYELDRDTKINSDARITMDTSYIFLEKKKTREIYLYICELIFHRMPWNKQLTKTFHVNNIINYAAVCLFSIIWKLINLYNEIKVQTYTFRNQGSEDKISLSWQKYHNLTKSVTNQFRERQLIRPGPLKFLLTQKEVRGH